MKAKKYIISISIFVLVLTITILIIKVPKKSYSINRELTRSDMQDIVVSTALSYWYNRAYSDYEQMTMDKDKTFS